MLMIATKNNRVKKHYNTPRALVSEVKEQRWSRARYSRAHHPC
jgi:hypothetical protein